MLCAVNEDIEVWDRMAGRVLLLDPEGRVLLSQDFDPARPGWSQRLIPDGGGGPNGDKAPARPPSPLTPPTPLTALMPPKAEPFTSPTEDPGESGGARA